jgi:hypothetical protein
MYVQHNNLIILTYRKKCSEHKTCATFFSATFVYNTSCSNEHLASNIGVHTEILEGPQAVSIIF